MSQQPLNPILSSDLSLERLREYIAGGIALIIILGMILISGIAIQNLPNAEQFARAKDLLLLITPFVGVVIGYYFNKVTADARAAALQRAADAANQTAIAATTESERAQEQAQVAQNQAAQARGALSEVVTASENVGAGQPTQPGTLGGEAGDSSKNIELLLALERAKRVLNSQ